MEMLQCIAVAKVIALLRFTIFPAGLDNSEERLDIRTGKAETRHCCLVLPTVGPALDNISDIFYKLDYV